MSCAKSCPSDFSGRRPTGTAAAGVGDVSENNLCPSDFSGCRAGVFARVRKCRPILSRERGHFNEQRHTTPEKTKGRAFLVLFVRNKKNKSTVLVSLRKVESVKKSAACSVYVSI